MPHNYLSTACHHRHHNDCRLNCKFCEEKCNCDCHLEAKTSPNGRDITVDELDVIYKAQLECEKTKQLGPLCRSMNTIKGAAFDLGIKVGAANALRMFMACKSWKHEDHSVPFNQIVSFYLRISEDREAAKRTLADEFEACGSTIHQWARGTSKPMPRLQEKVVEWIGNFMTQLSEEEGSDDPQ